MTKKEEILEYINTNINDTNFLRVQEIVISADRDSSLKTGDKGGKTFGMSRDNLLNAILYGYNDDLHGHAPGDAHLIQILSWATINK